MYTRKDDTFIGLRERGKIANDANADLFVSVHCNAHSSDAHGAETWVLGINGNKQNFEVAKKENSAIYLEDNYELKYSEYDINSPESMIGLTIAQEEYLDQSVELAGMMQNNFTKQLNRKDRSVKQNIFVVLHQTFMPSVLVEVGFLTNKFEGAYLNSSKGQDEMSKAIADAIVAYRNGVQNPDGFDAETAVEETIAITPPKTEEKEKVVEKEIVPETKKTMVVEEKKPEVQPQEITKPKEITKATVKFKVQLMASSKDIALTPANFKGLKELSKEPYQNLFRYLYGETSSYERAKELQQVATANGFNGCYVVAYKNGERISVKEAIKLAEIR